jgi:hypothetical protein
MSLMSPQAEVRSIQPGEGAVEDLAMHETLHLLQQWRSLERAGEAILLATLVRTEGSTYRRAGARMLMTAERWHAGGISGGCVEDDILRKAWWRTTDAGVLGRLELLIERLRSDDPVHPLAFIERCFDERRPGTMATIVGGDGLGRRVLVSPDGRVVTSVDSPALASRIAELALGALGHERSQAVTIGPCAPYSRRTSKITTHALVLIRQPAIIDWHRVFQAQSFRACRAPMVNAARRRCTGAAAWSATADCGAKAGCRQNLNRARQPA